MRLISQYIHCNTNLEPYFGLLSSSSIFTEGNIKELQRPHASDFRTCSRAAGCGARGVMGVLHSEFYVPPPKHEASRSLSPLNVTEPGDEACLQVCARTSIYYVLNVKAIYRPHLSCSKQARKHFRLQPL